MLETGEDSTSTLPVATQRWLRLEPPLSLSRTAAGISLTAIRPNMDVQTFVHSPLVFPPYRGLEPTPAEVWFILVDRQNEQPITLGFTPTLQPILTSCPLVVGGILGPRMERTSEKSPWSQGDFPQNLLVTFCTSSTGFKPPTLVC